MRVLAVIVHINEESFNFAVGAAGEEKPLKGHS